MFKSIFVVAFLLIIAPNYTIAQKALKKQGITYFEAGKYIDALAALEGYKKTAKEPDLLIKRGLCYYYTNQPEACIRDMAAADKLKSLDNRRYKYAAMAYFAKGEYIESANFYKTYLNQIKSGSDEWKEVVQEIKKCGNAKNLKYVTQLGFVENLGPNVNSQYDDFCPVQSPTQQGRYYFSSAREGTIGGLRNEKGLLDEVTGKFSSDMFLVDLKDGNWSSVLPFEQLLNTPKNDILQDFSSDGTIIYFVKTADMKYGTLYTDTFNLDRDPTKLPVAAQMPFMSENGDKDLFVFSDSLIFFSAIKPEGYGGYDLYYANKKLDDWQTPVNMGSHINTADDETGPFITKNGWRLFFSSNRPQTLGGFDIFSATYNVQDTWSTPINMGLPINSPRNDLNFELSSDGMSALFDSDRIESIGGKDIFIVYFKEQILDQLSYVDVPLFVHSDDIFLSDTTAKVETPIVVKDVLPARDFISRGLYFRNDDDVLNATNMAQIKNIADLMIIYPDIKVALTSHAISEGRPDFDIYFSIKRAEKIANILIGKGISPHRIHMLGCGANYPVAMPMINGIPSTLAEKTNNRIDVDIITQPHLNIKVMNDQPMVADQYRDVPWDQFVERNKGLTFRVQFAKVSQMLKSEILSNNKDIIIEKSANEDQYIYTMGNVLTYNEARLLKGELIRNNMPDAIVVPYIGGQKIDRIKALSMQVTYPELEAYLKLE